MNTRTLVLCTIVAICVIAVIVALGAIFGKVDDGVPESMKAKILVKGKCSEDYGSRPLLVVSMDGFKPDYLKRKLTPTMKEFAEDGVEADFMVPSYPTVTFPNHYTIVTGMYPASHGIIGNHFYDPELQESFSYKSPSATEGKWWGGEPIWTTLNKHGKKSATYFWPGSEADNGGQPTHWFKYNGLTKYEARIEQVLEWLTLPSKERPDFVTLYFNEPDSTGHKEGPSSAEMDDTVLMMDYYIRLLLEGLIQRNILNCVNIILLSDHGLAEGDEDKVLGITDYVEDIEDYSTFVGGALGRIRLFENKTKDVEQDIMRQISCRKDEMRVFTSKGFPKRLHYADNNRIGSIIIEVDAGYAVSLKADDKTLDGLHGYDNIFPEMNTIFLARGPDFKSGEKIKAFQNIELYNLMCQLTGITPAENNGTWGSLNHILLNPPALPELQKVDKPPVLGYPKDTFGTYSSASGCEGDSTILEPWMPSLDLTKEQEEEIEAYHAPWGIPSNGNPTVNISLLYQQDHVTGYSSTIQMPMWTTFTVGPDQIPGDPVRHVDSSRWSSDVRIPDEDTPTCRAYDVLRRLNFTMTPLFPYAFSRNRTLGWDSTHLISNAIPISQDIKARWQGLLTTLAPSWLDTQGPLNFIMGPAFDFDSNSLPDDFAAFSKKPAVPTDLFCVITRCSAKIKRLDACPTQELDSIAFIFHQDQPVRNCMSLKDYALKFSSRVRDVEMVTGLNIFPQLPVQHRVQHLLTIHQELWPME